MILVTGGTGALGRPTVAQLREAGHDVRVLIVGVDRIPYSYYRDKVVSERMIGALGVPFTILRATQLHDFVAAALRPQARWSITLSIDLPVQPIAVEEVAARFVELAGGKPEGRVADLGGPEALRRSAFAAQWNVAHGSRKRIWTLHLPGKIGTAFRDASNLTPLPGYGRQTIAQYAATDAA